MKAYYESESLKIAQARKFSFNTFPNRSYIFKFEARSTCTDRWVTGSSPFVPTNTQEECVHVINNFARCIQQDLQLNNGTEAKSKSLKWLIDYNGMFTCLGLFYA